MAMASIEIKLPALVKDYILEETTEEMRNALLLYPSIVNNTISHGRAAEILGIRKNELIDIYDKLGFSYLDFSIDDLDAELEAYRNVKEKGEIA